MKKREKEKGDAVGQGGGHPLRETHTVFVIEDPDRQHRLQVL